MGEECSTSTPGRIAPMYVYMYACMFVCLFVRLFVCFDCLFVCLSNSDTCSELRENRCNRKANCAEMQRTCMGIGLCICTYVSAYVYVYKLLWASPSDSFDENSSSSAGEHSGCTNTMLSENLVISFNDNHSSAAEGSLSYTHVIIHMHIHIHAFILIHMHIHMCIYIHTYIHTYIHIHTCSYVYMRTEEDMLRPKRNGAAKEAGVKRLKKSNTVNRADS